MAKKRHNDTPTKKKMQSSGNNGDTIKKGKPKKCDAIPGTKACGKTRNNRGMYCQNCTAWQDAGKRV